jgi:tripartite-type tricarboxylate transporter receptor subunit TctC
MTCERCADVAWDERASHWEPSFMTIGIIAVVCLTLAIIFGAVTAPEAIAESFPSRRITLTVPFPAGSATDGVTRRLAESIQNQAGVTVLVENKAGADGNLAALSVLKADPDGYNVFVTTNSTHAANVNLFNAMPFDPKVDFAPVAGIMSIPLLLTVKDDFPARSVDEFIALSKTRARPLSFGSGNTSSRGAAELFRYDAGIENAARALSRHAASTD